MDYRPVRGDGRELIGGEVIVALPCFPQHRPGMSTAHEGAFLHGLESEAPHIIVLNLFQRLQVHLEREIWIGSRSNWPADIRPCGDMAPNAAMKRSGMIVKRVL